MVEERVSEVVYLVRRLGTRKMFKVHIDRLKPYLTASGVRPPGSHDVEDLPPRPQPPPAAPAPAELPQPRDPALPPAGAIIAGAQRGSPDLYLMKVRGLSNGRVTLTYLPRSAGFVGATDTFFAGAWLDAWEWWYPRDPKGDLADAEAECLLRESPAASAGAPASSWCAGRAAAPTTNGCPRPSCALPALRSWGPTWAEPTSWPSPSPTTTPGFPPPARTSPSCSHRTVSWLSRVCL